MFPGSRFATPYFVEYGQDGRASVDNADRYVYALSNDGFWDNGNNLILGRVARSKIGNLRAADWQYYRGGDGMEDSAWTSGHGAGEAGAGCAGQAGHERRCLRAGTAALYHDRLVLSGRRRQDQGRLPHDELGFLRGPEALGTVDEGFDVRVESARLLLAAALSEVHERGRPPPVRHDGGRLEPGEVLSVDHRSVARGRTAMTTSSNAYRSGAIMRSTCFVLVAWLSAALLFAADNRPQFRGIAPTTEETCLARRWVAAKFEAPAKEPGESPGLVVLANHDSVLQKHPRRRQTLDHRQSNLRPRALLPCREQGARPLAGAG